MQVRDIMSRRFESIDRQESIREAAVRMRDLDIGMLPVEEEQEVIGTITDRDITVRAIANGADPNTTKVAEAMSNEIYACTEEDSLEEAARIMEDHQIHRLMVTDQGGRFIGMLALADIARNPKSESITAEIVEEVSRKTA